MVDEEGMRQKLNVCHVKQNRQREVVVREQKPKMISTKKKEHDDVRGLIVNDFIDVQERFPTKFISRDFFFD